MMERIVGIIGITLIAVVGVYVPYEAEYYYTTNNRIIDRSIGYVMLFNMPTHEETCRDAGFEDDEIGVLCSGAINFRQATFELLLSSVLVGIGLYVFRQPLRPDEKADRE
jgi:hypothetical protein